MTRYPDWATRLEVFLRENGSRKFKYGEWDCCLFVADAIKAMTGVDVAGRFRGWYRTERQAMDMIGGHVGNFSQARAVELIVESVTKSHDMPEVSFAKAKRGDVALIKRSKGHSLGLIALDGASVIVVTGNRLARVPFDKIREARAWRV